MRFYGASEEMVLDLREQIASRAQGRLGDVVRLALGEPGAVIGAWNAASLKGEFDAPGATSSVAVLRGVACIGPTERAWSVVLKVLAPVSGRSAPSHTDYWKREMLIYRSGLLDDLPSGLRAPRCYGWDEHPDGTIWLWQEHIREDGEGAWPRGRWALAARHLGRFNGSYLDGRPIPRVPWLAGRRLRTWLDRYGPLVARIRTAPDDAGVRRWWPRPVVDAVLRLWEERYTFCAALERLPQTFCHGDAIRRNLFAGRDVDRFEETVAIDWEHAGLYAVGEEVGQTLSVASAFYDVDPTDLPLLDEALFAGYLTGLGEVGWRGDPRLVRFAYAAHAALRNAFNAVGATVPDGARRQAAQQIYGHTWEELAERRAAVRPFLLARAQEARDLLATH